MRDLQMEKDQWVTVTVAEEHAEKLESFFRAHRIPFARRSAGEWGITWAVRAGMDHNEVMRYILENWGDLEDPEVWNEYAHLMLLCQYPDLQYEYECRRRGQDAICTQNSQNGGVARIKTDK